MSQSQYKKQRKKPMTRFERLENQQKYGKTMQHYENVAPRVAMLLFATWSVLWLIVGFIVPQAALWIGVCWLVGVGTLGGALLKVQATKSKSNRYLTVSKPLDELYRMNALDFEHAVAQKMRTSGYLNVQVTPSMGDGGIDILMEKDEKRYAVQCKKYHPESFIKIDLLRAFVYAYRKAGCQAGIYVTTAKFSEYARREMASEGVELIDGRGLVGM